MARIPAGPTRAAWARAWRRGSQGHQHAFAGHEVLINRVELRTARDLDSDGDGEVFAARTGAGLHGALGEIESVAAHDAHDHGIEVVARSAHGLDGEHAR